VGGKSFLKKTWWEAGEKIKFQKKKTETRAEKEQRKKVSLGWQMDRKENPISAPSIHVGALMGAGSLWPIFFRFCCMEGCCMSGFS
jgi:hypothetical protein